MKWVLIYWFISHGGVGASINVQGQVEFIGKESCEIALLQFKEAAAIGYRGVGDGVCIMTGYL